MSTALKRRPGQRAFAYLPFESAPPPRAGREPAPSGFLTALEHLLGTRHLKPRFGGAVTSSAVHSAVAEANVPGGVEGTDCSQHPCIVFGRLEGDEEAGPAKNTISRPYFRVQEGRLKDRASCLRYPSPGRRDLTMATNGLSPRAYSRM